MRILSFLLSCTFLFACQQERENAPISTASIGALLTAASGNAPHSATNIVFKSPDGGKTWQDVSTGLPNDLEVGRVLVDKGEIFLTSVSGLYRSSAATEAPVWKKEFTLNEISNVFPGRDGLYASSYGVGLFQATAVSGIWASLHNNLKDKNIRTVFETPGGAILVGSESGIYKSADGGKTWKWVFSDGAANSFAAAGDVLICGVSDGILRSTDGGEHWDRVLSGDGGAYGTKPLGDRLVASTDGGIPWGKIPKGSLANRLYTSSDNGKTWQRMDSKGFISARSLCGTTEDISATWSIDDIVLAGEHLFCSLDMGIFRSSDWGKTWELVFPANGKKSLNLTTWGKVIYAVKVTGC